MLAVTDGDLPGERPKLLARHVAAVAAGNALEFYDFLTFSYFAIYIGKTFFPFATGENSLLLSLATFGVGFLTRPLGGIVIGTMGDKIGRRPAMVLSFTLMGLGVIGLALTPSYAQIGYAAPILVILFRLLQGFALGGEVGPSTAFLIEAAPPEKRGFYGSLQYMTQDTAVLAAGIVGTVLASLLSDAQLTEWGWRLAFLFGAVIVPFGIVARRNLPETHHEAEAAGQPTRAEEFRPYRLVAIFGLMMLAGGTIATYVSGYMTTYAIDTLHMPADISFGVNIVLGVCAITFQPISGYFSDIFGRKPLMIIFGVLLVLTTVPAFWVISTYRTTWALYSMAAATTILLSLSATPVIVALTETMPKRIRAGAISIIYAFAIAIFGGSTQSIIKFLIDHSSPMAPAWYLTAAYSVALVAMVLMKETAPRKLGNAD
ncbi:MAG TPA: MFS transporter [Rhizomicrobium sp.]|nr:MFS transporter [Rhizomicrobium sp.]